MVFYWWLHQVEIQYQLQAPLKDWHLKINVFVIQRSRPCKYGVDLSKQITSLHNIYSTARQHKGLKDPFCQLINSNASGYFFCELHIYKANHLQKLQFVH